MDSTDRETDRQTDNAVRLHHVSGRYVFLRTAVRKYTVRRRAENVSLDAVEVVGVKTVSICAYVVSPLYRQAINVACIWTWSCGVLRAVRASNMAGTVCCAPSIY